MIRQLLKRIATKPQQNGASMRFASTVTYPPLNEFRTHTPEDGYVLNSIYERVQIPDLAVHEYVWKNLSSWQHEVAVVCGVTGQSYTYAKLRDHCAALAMRLQRKFKTGDVAAIFLPNIPDFAVTLLGVLEAGLVVTTLNPIYTAEEISRQLISCKPKIVFTLAETYQTIKAAAQMSKQSLEIVVIKYGASQAIPSDAINFSELIDTSVTDVDYNLLRKNTANVNDMCSLLYSSGTTGLPKGVMLTHSNLTSNCEMMNAKLPERTSIEPTTNDYQAVLPSILPFHHVYGFTYSVLSKLSLGCKIVSLPKFDPSTFLNSLIEHKATVLALVPPIVLFLTSSDKVTKPHLSHARLIVCAGAPLGSSDAEKLKKIVPEVEFVQGYGLTETSSLAFQSPNDCPNLATIGFAASNTQVKVARKDDPNFTGCDIDEMGELLIRGPNVMKGYLNNKEATEATFAKGNWFRTGDMVSYDKNGLFYVKDRLKELIKVKAYQVAPAELEEILRTHPQIQDAAVIGCAHDLYGEVPKAFVVKKKGASISDTEVGAFVDKQVAEYKRLRGGIQFVENIPKSSTGKILRRQLKQLYCQ